MLWLLYHPARPGLSTSVMSGTKAARGRAGSTEQAPDVWRSTSSPVPRLIPSPAHPRTGGPCPPEDAGFPHVVGPQRDSRQELVAEPILEGAVEIRGAAMGTQHLEVPQLRVPVHKELRLPAVDTDQHRVHHPFICVAGHELVGDAIGEELQGRKVAEEMPAHPCHVSKVWGELPHKQTPWRKAETGNG